MARNDVGEAARWAYEWHLGQVRKGSKFPYFIHCAAVAALVERAYNSDPAWEGWGPPATLIGAAFLHDVVEDCDVNEEDLMANFGGWWGGDLYKLIMEVTQVSKPEDGNRAYRKQLDAVHYGKSSPAGASIKLADLITNWQDVVHDEPGFMMVYQREARELLPRLKHGHPSLYDHLEQLVTQQGNPVVANEV